MNGKWEILWAIIGTIVSVFILFAVIGMSHIINDLEYEKSVLERDNEELKELLKESDDAFNRQAELFKLLAEPRKK